MIYFVQAVDGGPIKIGTTEDLPSRIRALEAHYARPLSLLRTLPGGRAKEREIHRRFAHLRFRNTEQFQPEPELLDFINRPLFVSASPVVEPMEVRPGGERKALIAFKCRQEYRDWVVDLARIYRVNVPQIIDRALVTFAESEGRPAPPER